jgi:protein TonB
MSAVLVPDAYGKPDLASRAKGIAVVVALHVLIGYALVSGMARKGLDLVKKPLEAVLIQEVTIPPPPPPPPPPPKKVEPAKEIPKVQAPPPPYVPPPDVPPPAASAAPVIVAIPTPPPAAAVIAPPPPAAPAAPVAHVPAPVAPAPKQAPIGLACPTQVAPEMPRRAAQDGTEGVVKAQILIRNGVVQEVTILSGPKVFHAAVKAAILRYKCVADGPEVIATQDFNFKLE